MKLTLPEKLDLSKFSGKMNLPKSLSLDLRLNEASRYFSGNVFEKALMSLDKATLWIIVITWLVALVVTGGAFMAVRGAASLKLQADTARAMEPPVPRITRTPLSKDQYDPLAARIKKQFPELLYEVTGKPSLRIYSNNGEEFNDWLNAIGYTDSMVPTIRWNLTSFCAGTECPGEGLMQAELVAETINISKAEGASTAPAAAAPVTTPPAK